MIRQMHRNFKCVIPSPKRNFGRGANAGWNVQGRMLAKVETAKLPLPKIRGRKPRAESVTKAEKETRQMDRKLKLQIQLIVCGTCATIIGICAGAFYFMSREMLALNSDIERLAQAVGPMQEGLDEIDGMAEDLERIENDLEAMSENLRGLGGIEKDLEYGRAEQGLIWKAIMLDAEGKLGPAEKAELEAERRELKRRYESRNRIVRCPEGGECK
ncbi:hypothetical protein JW721_00275 [Candidatus Micrarchaeota archaeon]|nr:hypothetical protein [Candidatus Micrarchaeota archaeon]